MDNESFVRLLLESLSFEVDKPTELNAIRIRPAVYLSATMREGVVVSGIVCIGVVAQEHEMLKEHDLHKEHEMLREHDLHKEHEMLKKHDLHKEDDLHKQHDLHKHHALSVSQDYHFWGSLVSYAK